MRSGQPVAKPSVSPWRRLFDRLNGSLRTRILIPTSLLFAATLVLMVAAADRLHASLGDRSEREAAERFTNVVADGLVRAIADRGSSAIPEILAAVTEHRPDRSGDLLSVSVVAADGTYAYSSVPRLLGERAASLPELGQRAGGAIESGTDTVVLRPLANCIGCLLDPVLAGSWVETRFSREASVRSRQDLAAVLMLTAIPALLLLLGIAWWLLGREAIAPLTRLVGAMRRAEAGEAHQQADEGRPDELGEAARRFDAAMLALHRSRAELQTVHREQLERADRFAAVGEMATSMSHEIKNPLAGLSGALEIMAGDADCVGMRGEIVAEMRAQVARLTDIMEGLLGFVREQPGRRQPTDVNAVLQRTVLLVTQRCRATCGSKLVPDLDPQLPRVRTDPAKLQQVLLNLCLNACQAMEGVGRSCAGAMRVRTYVRGPRVMVEIADQGPGIPPEVRPNIFKPFFTTRKKGNGLGLAISEQIVTDHGGHIAFTCPPEGGTVFTVALPIDVPGEPQA